MQKAREQIRRGVERAAELWSREAVLLTALVALVGMFAVTKVAVNFYSTRRAHLGRMWFNRGVQALKASQANLAIEDLRTSLSYDPDSSECQFRLAQALAAANRLDEAESYFKALLNSPPDNGQTNSKALLISSAGSGEINLELARLEARKDDSDAVNYYNNAIYGVWYSAGGVSPLERRWQARMELTHYWLSQHNIPQAQSELLALAANVPPGDYARRTEVAQLQLQAQAPRPALAQFQQALREKLRYPPALEGAGSAEIAIENYRDAIPYLQDAALLDPKNAQARKQLALAELVVASDPFTFGLGERERADRAISALRQAQAALSGCATQRGVSLQAKPAQGVLQQTWSWGQQMLPLTRRLSRNPRNVLEVMKFASTAEDLVASECGPLQGKDQALWLIGKKYNLMQASSPSGK